MLFICELCYVLFSIAICVENRVDRECGRDITIKGIHIPKGSLVGIPILAIHTDPEIYPEPDKFDPERYTQFDV